MFNRYVVSAFIVMSWNGERPELPFVDNGI
jgi:hypothetical protein